MVDAISGAFRSTLLRLQAFLRGRRKRGRGGGARKAGKMMGGGGRLRRENACRINPLRLISAFAGEPKFLIG